MHTRYFDLRDTKGQQKIIEDQITAAADILRQGGLVAIPTETVYGLGANALDETAVHKIFEAKGRPQDNPSSSMCRIPVAAPVLRGCAAAGVHAGPEVLARPADHDPEAEKGSAGRHHCRTGHRWRPLPGSSGDAGYYPGGGVPIAAPSANTSGRPSCTCAADCLEDMEGKIDAVVDGGPCQVGVESTIVDLTCDPPRLLRPGGMPLEALEEVVGPLTVDKAVTEPPQGWRTAQGPRHEVPPLCAESAGDCGYRPCGGVCPHH